MKQGADKVRRVGKGRALVGFAGGVADALTLLERLEGKFETHPGNVRRAAVDSLGIGERIGPPQARGDDPARDPETLLMVSGNGDVIEPDDGVAAIGSGGLCPRAARALMRHTELDAEEIARASLEVAAEICIYTNANLSLETLP